MAKEKTRITLKDQFAIFELLKTCASMNGEYCEYHSGWSDEKVGQKLKFTLIQVASVRKKLFGPLKNDSFMPYPKMLDRLSSLETQVAAIATQLEWLNKDLNQRSTAKKTTFDEIIERA
jgi:hypothetical protein